MAEPQRELLSSAPSREFNFTGGLTIPTLSMGVQKLRQVEVAETSLGGAKAGAQCLACFG